MFVALVIHRFDIALTQNPCINGREVGPQKFPKQDTSKPALGVNGPEEGTDTYLDLRERV